MKQILITILAVFFLNNVQAQSHNMGAAYNCKLKKGIPNSEAYQCPACEAKDKKEKAAKATENKRRDDAIITKANSEKADRQRAADLKKAEDKKNAHSGEVLINGQKNATVSNNSSVETTNGKTIIVSKKDNSKSKLYAKTSEGGSKYPVCFILNESGDTIISSSKIYARDWNSNHYGKIEENDIPKNVIIVEENSFSGEKFSTRTPKGYNLMNAKGVLLLEEKTINYIQYCGSDFFIFNYNESDDWYRGHNNKSAHNQKTVLYDYKQNKKYLYQDGYLDFYYRPKNDKLLFTFTYNRVDYIVYQDRIPVQMKRN